MGLVWDLSGVRLRKPTAITHSKPNSTHVADQPRHPTLDDLVRLKYAQSRDTNFVLKSLLVLK